MEHKQNICSDSAARPADQAQPPSALDFEPVAVAWRSDGWTPAKQRGFIEALADCGVVREAAARVGMSERSANYLRRRDGADSFGHAWDAAIRFGSSRLGSVAYERAVLGTVKPHFYRGRVVGEERVYDNRLLLSLLAQAEKSADPADSARSRAILADWDGWMDAIEHGLDAPRPRPAETSEQARVKAEAERDAYFARMR
jgi:hypothetical protein